MFKERNYVICFLLFVLYFFGKSAPNNQGILIFRPLLLGWNSYALIASFKNNIVFPAFWSVMDYIKLLYHWAMSDVTG